MKKTKRNAASLFTSLGILLEESDGSYTAVIGEAERTRQQTSIVCYNECGNFVVVMKSLQRPAI